VDSTLEPSSLGSAIGAKQSPIIFQHHGRGDEHATAPETIDVTLRRREKIRSHV